MHLEPLGAAGRQSAYADDWYFVADRLSVDAEAGSARARERETLQHKADCLTEMQVPDDGNETDADSTNLEASDDDDSDWEGSQLSADESDSSETEDEGEAEATPPDPLAPPDDEGEERPADLSFERFGVSVDQVSAAIRLACAATEEFRVDFALEVAPSKCYPFASHP